MKYTGAKRVEKKTKKHTLALLMALSALSGRTLYVVGFRGILLVSKMIDERSLSAYLSRRVLDFREQ